MTTEKKPRPGQGRGFQATDRLGGQINFKFRTILAQRQANSPYNDEMAQAAQDVCEALAASWHWGRK